MATAEKTEAGVAPSTNGVAPAEAAPKNINGVYVSTPIELREKLEADATAQGTSVAGMVRGMLAARYGIVLPAVVHTARVKYAPTAEGQAAKKAAQLASRKSHYDLVKAALAEYRAAHAAEIAAQKGAAKVA